VRGRHLTCPSQGCRRRRLTLAQQPTRCRLLPGHGCPVSSSSGEEGSGTNPGVPLPPREEVVIEFAFAGRANDHRCSRVARGGVPCRSCRPGTGTRDSQSVAPSQAEEATESYPSGTQRKSIINTQRSPIWRANCRCFGPGGPSTGPTSEFVAACPCPDGLMQDGTQEGNKAYVILHRDARSRGYKRYGRAKTREREKERVRP
jgi:hypothetical protein